MLLAIGVELPGFRAGNYYYVGRFLEVLDSVSGVSALIRTRLP